MTTLTLWQRSASPPSWAVRIMADILGLKLELKDVEFTKMEHKSPAYRKMNPMGTFPVLKDGEFIISDSHAVIIYLLDKYGNEEQKKLYPSNREEKALVHQAMFFDTGIAFIRVKNIALPIIMEGADEFSDKKKKECDDVYETVDMYLDGKDYIAINRFTIADITTGCAVIALNDLYPLNREKFPRAAAWLDRLRARSYFQQIALPGSQQLSSVVKAVMEKNKADKKPNQS